MNRILVAMQREADALGLPCGLIGIGATDLPDTSFDDTIINIGYCGGYGIRTLTRLHIACGAMASH